MDCSPPGSSVHGVLQARLLEWVAIPFSRGSFWPWDPTQVSCIAGSSLVAHMVKNLPATQETRVGSLRPKDSLEEGMATHSSILAWRISQTEEPGGLQSMGSQRVAHDWATFTDVKSKNVQTFKTYSVLRFWGDFFWQWVFTFLVKHIGFY